MAAPDSQDQTTPSRRSRRELGWGLVLILLLVLALFHRPLIFASARLVAVELAARKHLALDFKLGGSLYSNLILEQVTATATGPSAVREFAAKRVELRYSLPDLIRLGRTELVKSAMVQDATLVIDPSKAPPKKKKNTPFKIPALIPKQVEIRNANLLVRAPQGEWGISGGLLTLYPDRPGMLAIGKLTLPAGREYTNLSATTSYSDPSRGWHLVLKGLGIGPEVEIRVVDFDLSKLPEKQLGVTLGAGLFKGEANLAATLSQKGETLEADLKLSGTGIVLQSVGQFAGIEEEIGGRIGSFKSRVTGDLNRPVTWVGAVSVGADALKWKQLLLDRVAANIELGAGQVHLTGLDLVRGPNSVVIHGAAQLPDRLGPIAEGSGDYRILLPVAEEIGPVSGAVDAAGTFELGSGRLKTSATVSGTALVSGTSRCESLVARINAEHPFPAGVLGKGLAGHVSAVIGPLESAGYHADGAKAELNLQDGLVELKEGAVWRALNRVVLKGTYLLPEDLHHLAEGKLGVDLDLAAPQLEMVSPKLGGFLAVTGRLDREKNVLGGKLSVSGSGLNFQELRAESLAGEIGIAENQATVRQFRVNFATGDFATAQGEVQLAAPFSYRGRVTVKIGDLAMFQPVLRSMGREEIIGGVLDLNWEGSGREWSEGMDPREGHSGVLDLSLRKGSFGVFQAVEAAVSGTYTGESIQCQQFRISSNRGELESTIYYSNSLLSLQNITLRQGALVVLAGNAFVPIDLPHWKDPGALIPANGKVAVDLFSQSLDLKKVGAALGQEWPVGGSVSAIIQASGPVDDLKAVLQLQGRELQADAAPKLAPAKLDLAVNLAKNRVVLKGIVFQPEIKPLLLDGEIPFELRKVIAERQIDNSAPIKLRAFLEKSSLAPLAKSVPDIRYVEGEISLDVRAGGTISKPVLAGAAVLKVPALRFQKPTLPSIANVQSRLLFDKDQLTIGRLEGEIGGGRFQVGGRASFQKLTEPVLDFRAVANNLLVQRNNSTTIRANADLQIQGPLKSGTVMGSVGLTNSRFFRQVEILPIGLPGRPTRRVPKMNPQLILPPVLKEWHFEVNVRTDDPFKIRSNLANGEATVALAFRGTGAKPSLNGQVEVQNLAATLPFSKMNVDYGYIYFSPATGLDPKLDIHGVSELREYHIDIYIHGTAQDPQSTLTSDPPLPQEDIVALLATGATVKEIGGNPDVLAGRAAVLLFDKLYRKVFKRNSPTSGESVPSRLQFDLGGVSATTGKQELTTQFKLTENIFLIGEVGIEGEVGGKIKYVLRFR